MSAMDSEQFPNSFQLSNNNNNNGYREYSVADSVPGYFPSAASNHAGASYLVTSVKPNIVQGTNHYSSWIPASYSNRLPSTTSQPTWELGKIEYSQGSSLFMNLDQHYPTNAGAWTMNNTTSEQRDSLSYPLDPNYSYYSTIAGSQSNNNYPQTNNNNNMWNRYSSPYMDSSQKESLIWKLERENQNMRKELEEYRKEIDRLRSLMNQGESSRPPPSTSDSASRCQSRYWTPEEHQRFLEAIQIYGHKDVKSIATYVGTRSRTQVRTHAQKYFQRISRNCDSSRIGKRCMSEPNLYGIESQTTCSRFEETSGGEESSSQDELNKQTPSGIDLLSAVASTTCKVPHD
ncbi:hypothetical protein GAYE_SCF45G5733 [Galdieria yellowstonensis]|uniref:Myb domain-containing protein n=1 Tax=Galdieria yellowstonensis TaxID=3028027 RepID=A0AAV9IK32_9RHOD|nr:hypothetical protein GAYE_SCF45G5733 [Galdieria yellowstonensis]